MMDTHRKHSPKGACFLMCVLRQDRQRGEPEGRRRGAAVYGVSVLGCSSSVRIVQEVSDSEVDWKQSTACQLLMSVLRQDYQRGEP